MIIEISVAVIALAFAVLVIYLVAMIRSLQVTLGQVNETLSDGRKQLDDVMRETKKIIENTNEISADIQKKVEAFDPLFKTVEDLGEILEHKTSSWKEEVVHERPALTRGTSSKRSIVVEKQTNHEPVNLVADFVELTGLGLRLWQNLKKRR